MKNGLIVNGNIKYWYLNDKLHREDGPACEWADGNKCWYINGKLHREDGPAVEYSDGSKYWYINNKLHREDGPAIEIANGGKWWHLNGKWIDCSSQEQFEKLLKLKAFW